MIRKLPAWFYERSTLPGAILTLLGSLLAGFLTVKPLVDAIQGAAEVENLSAKGTVVGLSCAFVGLCYLLGGERAYQFFNPPPGRSKVPVCIASVLIVGASFAMYFAVKWHIESLGYRFPF